MKTTVKLITPEYAKELLERNTMNRKPYLAAINDYSRQMAAGLWNEETGEAIKIANDGTLLDGQQRLLALIKAGVSLNFLVIEGLEPDVFRVIDSGKKRSAGDVFYTSGIENANNIAAGIRRYLLLKTGKTIGNINSGGGSRYNGISSSELLSIYSNRPRFWQAAFSMASKWYIKSGRMLGCADFIGYYAYFYDINEDDAFEFMSQFGEGVNLNVRSVVKLLREKLTAARLNTRYVLTGAIKTGYIIKSWNYFRKNENPKILKYAPESEPTPIAK